MSLVGVVANEKTDNRPPVADERIAIGASTQHQVLRSGYLYGFANDSWEFYFNNRGTVRLTPTRS